MRCVGHVGGARFDRVLTAESVQSQNHTRCALRGIPRKGRTNSSSFMMTRRVTTWAIRRPTSFTLLLY